MRVIGLTGTIASGKSTVARWFRSWGAEVVEADRIGHELLHPGRPAYGRLVKAFGRDILRSDGRINRKRLGGKVFADPKARQTLNRIVHPLLLRDLKARIREARKETGNTLVVVAALIPEWRIGNWFDLIVAVTSPQEKRFKRLVGLGYTEREARQRLASQLSESEKCLGVDLIIQNRGSLSDLREGARLVWNTLKEGPC